jgi:hypothetical protein
MELCVASLNGGRFEMVSESQIERLLTALLHIFENFRRTVFLDRRFRVRYILIENFDVFLCRCDKTAISEL